MDETVIPCIRTRKRRLVPPDKRKKASFSCDRCKIRKIACHRASSSEHCFACQKAGVVCDTTIRRKKKIRGPIENIGLHYKCLLVLVKNLFPNVDANNIDALIDVGERQGFSMPSRYGGQDGDDVKDLSLLISTGKAPNSSYSRASSCEETDSLKQEEREGVSVERSSSTSSAPTSLYQDSKPRAQSKQNDLCHFFKSLGALAPEQDYIIIDLAGNSHCVGQMGAPGMLDTYLRTIEGFPNMDHLTYSKFQSIVCGEIIISSSHEPTHSKNLTLLYQNNFPYFSQIGYQQAQNFVNVFFRCIHPRILCFNEATFRDTHERFWAASANNTQDRFLTNSGICCIYMVWLLGSLYGSANADPEQAKSDAIMAEKYLDIIKLCLSDMVLMPTLDGVRCLMLMAVYMDNNKRRESCYVLLELASRQAVSLGLNRASLLLCVSDKGRIEEMRRVWWTLFMLEVSMSTQMGRLSCFEMSDIDVEYPSCLDVCEDVNFNKEYFMTMDLTKMLYDVLEYRLLIHHSEDMMTEANLDRAVQIGNKLTSRFNEADPTILDVFSHFTDSKMHVHLRYHYYRIVLTLPYLMKVARAGQSISSGQLSTLVDQCLWSCVGIAELAFMAHCNGSLNGTVNIDIFYLYHAVMGLVIGYCMGGNAELSFIIEREVGTQTIESAIEKIRVLQLSTSGACKGTLSKISKYIDAFTYGFEQLRSQLSQRQLELVGQMEEPGLNPVGVPPPMGAPDVQEFISAARNKVSEVDLPCDPRFLLDDLLALQLRNTYGTFNFSHTECPPMYDDMTFAKTFGTGN